MTVEEIETHLEAIAYHKSQADKAHSLEKSLWLWTLDAIAQGAGDPRALAQTVLKSRDIPFTRSYG